MKKLFDFTCRECKETFDKLIEYCQETECPICGGKADKIITAPRIELEGYSGAFPGAADRWVKKHKQHLAAEKKRNE